MKTEQKTTIDDLAVMLKRQFDHIDSRFEKIDARFEQMDARFDKLEAKFDRFESRFDNLETIVLDDHRPRIKNLEKKLGVKA